MSSLNRRPGIVSYVYWYHLYLKVGGEKTPEEMADDIESILGVKPDVTIECSGVEASVRYKKNIGKKSKINALKSDI